jgi:predicted amidophosphoribosyltransferase
VVGGILVRSAFRHEGAAQALVHRLKYEAVAGVADRLAEAIVPVLPLDTSILVPVPRVRLRHLGYGVDPGVALATAIGRRAGLAVDDGLAPAMWARRRAGPTGRRRGLQRFRLRRPVPAGAVLVDDVVTTGSTLGAAARVTGATRAVTATSSGHSALTRPAPAS